MSNLSKGARKLSPEFWLLAMMLSAMVILVIFTLNAPITGNNGSLESSAILDYRSGLLSGLLTAFGAWIGAGAAYFFGRENIREAYEGIRSLQQPSPIERLRNIKIREIPPRALVWSVTRLSTLGEVIDQLDKKPDYWFIPVLSEDGKIETVLEEEAIWKYYQAKMRKEQEENADSTVTDTLEKIRQSKIGELIDWITAEDLKQFKDKFVSLSLDQSVFLANEQMDQKNVALAIISDHEGKAKYFITSGDVRRVTLQLK